ncbi:hypothetical protein KAI04_04045 [Candidatus Pacearchaeota archaeon]|nr:hypothetical protein [Candidatus Pacearchaeota archaeon]
MKPEEVFRFEDEPEKNTYVIPISCSNCKKERYYYIPIGREVSEFLENEICPFCECNIIKQKIKKE